MTAVAVGRFSSSTGSQTVTIGFRPKLVILWHSYQTAEETQEDELYWGIGAASAADEQWAFAARSEHGSDPTDTYRILTGDSCLVVIADTGSGHEVIAEAALTGFTSTGFTLSYSDAASTFDVSYAAFGGDGEYYAGMFPCITSSGTQTITDPGFLPAAGLFFATHCASLDAISDHVMFSAGGCSSAGDEAVGIIWDRDNRPNSEASREFWRGKLFGINNNGGHLVLGDFNSWESTGFEVAVNYSTTPERYVAYVVFGNVDAYATYEQQPSSTGTQAMTGAGFQPNCAFMWSIGHATPDAIQTHALMQFGAAAASDESTTVIESIDSASAGDTARAQADGYVGWRNATNVAEVDSFDADGWTLDWTAADGTQRYFGYLLMNIPEATGWPHNFNGVANADIAKINGVAIADIAKVNGVA